jgi:hypothetical protein
MRWSHKILTMKLLVSIAAAIFFAACVTKRVVVRKESLIPLMTDLRSGDSVELEGIELDREKEVDVYVRHRLPLGLSLDSQKTMKIADLIAQCDVDKLLATQELCQLGQVHRVDLGEAIDVGASWENWGYVLGIGLVLGVAVGGMAAADCNLHSGCP